ncbi:hypothetical protein AZF37_04675 [endosymbiont 'TC1' of Trimyema compressum]|uniref:site-2 protease family protein n=1 Tax=endosymbiont 'TC1' of Trimyema compressum TaxID=243899 RepID=UPI0007F0A9A3|nr:site-2 protease family protein [endosymbiont 'TC1' of Trimyema compressum]AMP20559.1 hypothetical protein AZF37_04675 [endosymbiont 'TC1' of Trimyema compressum]
MLFGMDPLSLLYIIPAILIGLTFHEIAHGYTAYLLGDKTAKEQGRLSLNPLKHIDPIGFISMILVGFGWAKPVMMNPYNFKNYKDGIALTAVAGPLANFVMAIIGLLLFKLVYIFPVPGVIITFLTVFIQINFMLAAFNILPLPVLDGFKVIMRLFPDSIYDKAFAFERRYGIIILLILILTRVLSFIWTPVFNFLVIVGSKITFTSDAVMQMFLR